MRAMAAEYGDLDVVIQAFGATRRRVESNDDPVAAAALAEVNYVGAVSSGLAVAAQLRTQGHGTLVVLSSVAGVRTRASNFVYGSTKAGPRMRSPRGSATRCRARAPRCSSCGPASCARR